jgi:hypothetical protein
MFHLAPSRLFPVMKFTFHFILLLGIYQTVFGLPIPADSEPQQKAVSKFQWKKYLPIIGTIGLLGAVGSIYFIGSKTDQAFAAIKKIKSDPVHGKYLTLSEEERDYVEVRAKLFGQDLDEGDKTITETEDQRHGWPKLEMPETEGMEKGVVRELERVYAKLDKAIKKVEKAKENERVIEKQRDEVFDRRRKTQLHAAIIAATEWKQAVNKAKEQQSNT